MRGNQIIITVPFFKSSKHKGNWLYRTEMTDKESCTFPLSATVKGTGVKSGAKPHFIVFSQAHSELVRPGIWNLPSFSLLTRTNSNPQCACLCACLQTWEKMGKSFARTKEIVLFCSRATRKEDAATTE